MYEAYLQVYKTREEFVRNFSRHLELNRKLNTLQGLNKEETKELQKLDRLSMLADEFEKSHRYMLEKDSYNQQDIDYAFELTNKEKDGAYNDELTEKKLYASDIYKSLIFEKVFAGQKERILHAVNDDKKDGYSFTKWLEEDMAECVDQKKGEMTRIIRSLANNLNENGHFVKNPTTIQIHNQLHFAIEDNWLRQLFRGDEEKDIRRTVDNAWGNVSTYYGKLYSAFHPIVDQIIKEMPKQKNEAEEED